MLNKKLFEVLQHLDKAEQKRFRLFLQSPYFNRGSQAETLLKLYDDLAGQGFDENAPSLSKALTFSRFFPGLIYKENEKSPLDGLTSDMFGLLRKFIALNEIENKDWAEKEMLSLVSFYRRKGIDERFKQSIAAMRKQLKAQKIKDHDFFNTQYLMEMEQSQYQRVNNTVEDDANLVTVDRSLDIQYLIKKMDLICALEHQGKLSDINLFDSKLTQSIQHTITGDEYPEAPLIEIYIYILKLIREPENESFLNHLDVLLQKHDEGISLEYLKVITGYYRFFWIRKYFRSGGLPVQQKMFDIYKSHYERGFFYIDGKIAANALRTLLNFALKTGHNIWIKTVLDSHAPQQLCGTKYAAEVHSLNYAEYYFYEKDYDKAIEHLVFRNFENPTFSILADVLMIKVYYETRNELLEYRLNAMRQKIVRAAFAAEVKARYHNFINKVDKLIKYGWDRKSAKIANLRAETGNIPNIIEREWLLEKMADA